MTKILRMVEKRSWSGEDGGALQEESHDGLSNQSRVEDRSYVVG